MRTHKDLSYSNRNQKGSEDVISRLRTTVTVIFNLHQSICESSDVQTEHLAARLHVKLIKKL